MGKKSVLVSNNCVGNILVGFTELGTHQSMEVEELTQEMKEMVGQGFLKYKIIYTVDPIVPDNNIPSTEQTLVKEKVSKIKGGTR